MFHIVAHNLFVKRHSALVALCFFLGCSGDAFGKIIKAQVEYVEKDMLYLSSGDVVFTAQGEKSWSGTHGLFELDEDHHLLSVRSVPLPKLKVSKEITSQNYSPSIVADIRTVHSLYNRMRSDYRESAQCFNMAHVWAFEEYERTGLKSMKMFLFFTKKYIRRHNFKWWFHVSPMVLLKDGLQSQMMILDRRYTLSPFDVKTWTDHFIIGEKPCKQVDKFYDYYNHQESQDCYLISRNMYYWQPRSIRLGDQTEGERSTFRTDEVRAAKAGF